jgi:hypothetical protein
MTVLERRMNALERYNSDIIFRHECVAKLAEELKDQENDAYTLMEITKQIQGFVFEIKELEMQIKFTEREIELMKKYETTVAL